MSRIGLVGAGAMGSALGAGWRAAGHEVRTCVAGRSSRTQRLVRVAGLTEVPTMTDVVAADVVVSVVPPAEAVAAARQVGDAARDAAHRPLVADLNAVSPVTVRAVQDALQGCELVDGSISGPPPRAGAERARVYLSGPRAGELPDHPWLDVVVLDGPVGSASALKMCTASMYKGTKALVMQALLTAEAHGVRAEFLADCAREWPTDVPGWHTDVAVAASKAWRFVGEMEQIAQTQADAGLPGELFDGVAAAYARAARTPLGRRSPEEVDRDADVAAVLADLTEG